MAVGWGWITGERAGEGCASGTGSGAGASRPTLTTNGEVESSGPESGARPAIHCNPDIVYVIELNGKEGRLQRVSAVQAVQIIQSSITLW
jgi:hypothetical protein